MPPRRRPPLRATADSVLLHDMKNMGQRLQLLLSNLDEHYGDPEFKRSVAELLRSTVERLDAMATQWAGRRGGVLIKVPLDVNELLGELLRTSGVQSGAVNVGATFGEPPRIWGDPALLREGLASLLENALEAATARISIRTGAEGRGRRLRAVLEIQDDGPGMTEDFLRNRLFRPFQTTKRDGVGLGLYSARQIVSLHRGNIEIRSGPGEGTTVRISLPAATGSP
ncbi:MAG TPA: ATP-binding protein [Thermoanaerobaculia bacterium]|nr:ATP-binding protein [Thermoanaerobaculia bacterium]